MSNKVQKNVLCWNKMIEESDIPRVVDLAKDADLLCLFADDFGQMLDLSDACYELCPQMMAIFGPQCDYAEVAFSAPRSTVPLRTTLGQRKRQTIQSPQALGSDTLYVVTFAVDVALRLLLGNSNKKIGDLLPPCYANAPLFVMGLRRRWIFASMPDDQVRSTVLVGGPTSSFH